ncbi:hypothetical protein BGZ82_000269 [Podila clonocystis]|nr:hypothetical protein BGZ82_000269 [Podila clonocystis]
MTTVSIEGGGGRGGGDHHGPGHALEALSNAQKKQIADAVRPATIQVASEGTDDIIVASRASEKVWHFALMATKPSYKPTQNPELIRRFVNSCLLNLSNHHNVDTSSLLTCLTSEEGLKRLNGILGMTMSIEAAHDLETLSFQFVVLPFIGVLTRESICRSTMDKASMIYDTVYAHRKKFIEAGIIPSVKKLIDRAYLEDRSSAAARIRRDDGYLCVVTSLSCALLAIVRLIYQIVIRIPNSHINLLRTVRTLHIRVHTWAKMSKGTERDLLINKIMVKEVKSLLRIVSEAEDTVIPLLDVATAAPGAEAVNLSANPQQSNAFDPPGESSVLKARHDNDHVEISDINILPTQQEISCIRAPFLPFNGVADAPRFLAHGWKCQLDTHFRLCREDMMDPLRQSVKSFLVALRQTPIGEEDRLLDHKELRKLLTDNSNLNVYGDVMLFSAITDKNAGGNIEIGFSQPPQILGAAKGQRTEFWERSKNRIMLDGLICLVSRDAGQVGGEKAASKAKVQMVLAVIARRDTESLVKDKKVARVSINLADPLQYLQLMNSASETSSKRWFLVESPATYFESYRPILKTLQNRIPATMPFGKYLAPTAEELDKVKKTTINVDLPIYSRAPTFQYDLSVLLNGRECRLDVNNTSSIKHAIETLQNYSTMDGTQANALVETLCREVALIHGPPGTGKTWIGAALMQVLLANSAQSECGPVLYVCRTDLALDQALNYLGNIVRIRLEQYSAEAIADVATLDNPNNGAFEEIHHGLLRQCSVVAMTTNGVIKSQELIKTLAPKIIICEEAGEILEAHILSVLSPSTQHLILIGNHKHFRPHINKYNLSSDTPIGKKYNLDMSLFERLATSTKNSLPISELKTQRRMRPSISELIRQPLYPDLIDGDDVHHHPSVRGMAENLFFMNHYHAEDVNSKNGVQSYSNAFEVSMVNAFAKYLVKNGYGEPGEVAIVTTYLAQLSKLRIALKGSFKLVINERDQEQLQQYDMEIENEGQDCGEVQDGATIWLDNSQKQISLSTIENFKGAEAKIVIISLVRNQSENHPSMSGKICPLESASHTNVLLSRAQHGMFIIGNADLMENGTNNLWLSVISDLRIHDRIGSGFPLKCQSHPEQAISMTLNTNSPDASSRATAYCPSANMCEKLLEPCGHQCPSICGETCPSQKFCVECRDSEAMTMEVDVVEGLSLGKIDVDKDPILELTCGHAFTLTTLDGMMDMNKYYKQELDLVTGRMKFTATLPLPGDEVNQVCCPNCRKSILHILRYGRQIKGAQLSMRLKKYQIAQGKAMTDIKDAFDVARNQIKMGHDNFVLAISAPHARTWIAPPLPEMRHLGKFALESDIFPISDFSSIAETYGIPIEHSTAWSRHIQPVAELVKAIDDVTCRAAMSPTKRVFEAAISRLYRLEKGRLSNGSDRKKTSTIIQECIQKCGLPPDGNAGSSYVESLAEKTNALLLALSEATDALEAAGTMTGWYWFVEDLRVCCLAYTYITREVAWKGHYNGRVAYSCVTALGLLCDQVRWLGLRPLPEGKDAKLARLKSTDDLIEKFKTEHRKLQHPCCEELKKECLARAAEIEERLGTAVRMAHGELILNQPPTEAEKVQIYGAISVTLRGSGHWYRCPNGHTYVIGGCGRAIHEAECPDCGAAVGGTGHQLRKDNAPAPEI